MTEQPPPQSASPALAAGLAVAVSSAYAAAEDAILAALTLHVRAALSAASPGDALRDRTAAIRSTAQRAIATAEHRAARAVPKALGAAYGRGHGVEKRATSETVRRILDYLAGLRTAVLSWLGRVLNGLTAALRTPAPLPTVDSVLQRTAARGITAIRDNRGRSLGLVSHVESTVQHEAGQAVIEGFADRLTADGDDLVIVTESPHPCPLCTPWEHRVLSVSGRDPQRPSMATARAAGLFHPRCHHTVFRWHPGFVWHPHSLHHRPGTYEATQRQRDIERHIRSWKRREAAALDDVTRLKARAKVRAWQAELRRHLAAEGLTRSRQRERTDYGHTPPIRHAHG